MSLHVTTCLHSGVINFVPADVPDFGDVVTSSNDLAGISFTGSVKTFTHLWQQVGQRITSYKTYPKLVGGSVIVTTLVYTYM